MSYVCGSYLVGKRLGHGDIKTQRAKIRDGFRHVYNSIVHAKMKGPLILDFHSFF